MAFFILIISIQPDLTLTDSIVPPFVEMPLHTRELSADLLTPVGAFLKLRDGGRFPFLLESASGGERFSRYSILGTDPIGEITAKEPGEAQWLQKEQLFAGSLREVLHEFAARAKRASSGFPFSGGLVGAIGFDFIHELERLPQGHFSASPMAWLGEYPAFVLFDHLRHTLVLAARTDLLGEVEAERILETWSFRLSAPLARQDFSAFRAGDRRENFTRADFCSAVERLKQHVRAGDIFQGVLSQSFTRECEGDPFQLYRALRRVNPSPYMFYHETPAGTFVGASPELLVDVRQRNARILPIAGTRPRGTTPAEDAAQEADLKQDPKERAEHMMLVDLARNDLGRISDYGSVTVDELAMVHHFSHVMHLVSRVSGRLRNGLSAVDALCASFPAGTVSGAPKVRALEIILENEPDPRGFYAGASGFLGYDGNAEFCITLRTAVVKEGVLAYQAGAGIVAESVPDREYEETLHKAGAIERALRLAEDRL